MNKGDRVGELLAWSHTASKDSVMTAVDDGHMSLSMERGGNRSDAVTLRAQGQSRAC